MSGLHYGPTTTRLLQNFLKNKKASIQTRYLLLKKSHVDIAQHTNPCATGITARFDHPDVCGISLERTGAVLPLRDY